MFTQIKFQDALNCQSITQFLQHCSQTKNLRSIQAFHCHVLRSSLFFISPNLQARILESYTSCINENNLKFLTQFFKCLSIKNPLPFNSIISHFSQHGSYRFALHTFSFMHYNSVHIDSYALCSSLNSATCLKNVCFGKMMHARVEKSGWLASVFVGSALVDFYSKSLCLNDAAKVFDEIPEKNSVCANALMSGYAEAKMWSQGIELIRTMPILSLPADNYTFSAALRACIGLCALEFGRQIHANVIRSIIDIGADVILQSLLIEMYGKCGLTNSAEKVFNMAGYGVQKQKRDVVLWTSMLGVYAKTGNYIKVIKLFKQMQTEGIKPDGVAFLTVISACAHTGQVDLGMKYFESLKNEYNLIPSQEHYSSLVDMLCRAGELEKACKFISEIPCNIASCTISMWGALLSACNECGNVTLGKFAAQRALELERNNVGVYVLLSNLYASNGMWSEIEELREIMKERGLKKDIGWSSI